jgi:hypothetical protein
MFARYPQWTRLTKLLGLSLALCFLSAVPVHSQFGTEHCSQVNCYPVFGFVSVTGTQVGGASYWDDEFADNKTAQALSIICNVQQSGSPQPNGGTVYKYTRDSGAFTPCARVAGNLCGDTGTQSNQVDRTYLFQEAQRTCQQGGGT